MQNIYSVGINATTCLLRDSGRRQGLDFPSWGWILIDEFKETDINPIVYVVPTYFNDVRSQVLSERESGGV